MAKATGNAFMASAAKSKQEMESIQKGRKAKQAADGEEMQIITVSIPKSLHRKALLHKIDTGESVTALVSRLLSAELG